jgi:hypothetical protein
LLYAGGAAALGAAALGIGAATARPAAADTQTYQYGPGYWMASSDGGVFAFGHAGFDGSPANATRKSLVSVAGTASGKGYWVVAADGGVFSYGDAGFFGSAGSTPLTKPVVGMAATASGNGYWLVASDGGVFSYGDAEFYGSAGSLQLRQGIVGIAATPSGHGYWLVGADGGVFAYGDAGFYGSPTGDSLRAPIVSVASAPDGKGYWLAGADGGVFAYGDAEFLGSPSGTGLRQPVVGLSPTPTGHGYWMAGADGGVFAYGDAGYYGGMSGHRLSGRVVGIAGGYAPAKRQQPAVTSLSSNAGYDISWPQCPQNQTPPAPFGFGLVGVTGGKAFTDNPCLGAQLAWAHSSSSGAGLYLNLNAPKSLADGATGPSGTCAPGNVGCNLTNYGANTVIDAIAYADSQGAHAPMWWLDVETENYWAGDRNANALVVQGAIDELHRRGLGAGIYSTGYQFRLIAGDYAPGVPVWIAGAPDMAKAASWCNGPGFAGGTPWLIQTLPVDFDVNVACSPVTSNPSRVFDLPGAPVAPVFTRTVARVKFS